MNYDVIEIKTRIKQEFEKHGLSAYSILPTIGLSKNTLDKHNVSMPKADTLSKIADYLGCSVDYLLGRPEPDLTAAETALLDLFRSCSETDRAQLLDLAELYAERERSAQSKRAE